MTNKIILIFLFYSTTILVFGQSKKEQIKTLNLHIDRINIERKIQEDYLNLKIKKQSDSLNLEIKKRETSYSKEVANKNIIIAKLDEAERLLVKAVQEDPKVVLVEYKNEINGYLVKVIWKPNGVIYDHTVGPAIIEFYCPNDSTKFTLTNNNFGILNNKLPFSFSENGSEIIKYNQKNIKLFYDDKYYIDHNSQVAGFGTTNEPFFFQDLDFDNRKELIISEINNGQRGIATFKVYKFESSESNRIESELYNVTTEEPFKSLDEMSTIDYINKRILIYNSGGWCSSSTYIYTFKSSEDYVTNKFLITAIIQEELDEIKNKCSEVNYRVINQSKQFISKKEVK
jgi:hypothetical protein